MIPTNQIQADIKQNKIKEGSLIKRSRILKEWKERWMVLTKTYLYSFTEKGVYRNPTETIPLSSIETMKSYYKEQYEKPWIFRLESSDVNLYLSAKSGQDKWAWMTAIERMIDRVCSPNIRPDSYNQIRQTIKMGTAYRESMNSRTSINFSETDKSSFVDSQKSGGKNARLATRSATMSLIIPPLSKEIIKITELGQGILVEDFEKFRRSNTMDLPIRNFGKGKEGSDEEDSSVFQRTNTRESFVEIMKSKLQKGNMFADNNLEAPGQSLKEPLSPIQMVQKVIEKERIIYVPEIREKIIEIEKIVYVNSNNRDFSNSSPMSQFFPSRNNKVRDSHSGCKLSKLLSQILSVKCETIKPMIDFTAFLLTQKFYDYHEEILEFCLKGPEKRYFSEMLLLALNEQPDESKLNTYLRFITHIYESTEQYFFYSDTKVMIDILLRQFSMNRSQLNQHLIMNLFRVLSEKIWWSKCDYRRKQLRHAVKLLGSTGNTDNMFLASELKSRI